MFFVGAFLGEQIKSLQARMKESQTQPTADASATNPQENKNDAIESSHATLKCESDTHDEENNDAMAAESV